MVFCMHGGLLGLFYDLKLTIFKHVLLVQVAKNYCGQTKSKALYLVRVFLPVTIFSIMQFVR